MKSRIALTNQDLREGSIGAVGATISAAQTSKRELKGRLLRLNVEACESGQVQVISAYHR